jgi:hypothetical protein
MSDFPIQINATQLFYRDFFLFIQGETQTPTLSTKTVQEIPLAPGLYNFQFGSGMIADFNFTVTADGKVDYDPSFSGFLSGGGGTSNKLTILGLPVTLDARLLTGANPAVLPSGVLLANAQLTDILPEDWIVYQTVRLLPTIGCSVSVGSAMGLSYTFNLKPDGTFDYLPELDSSQGGFLKKGPGTSTLTFLGYPLSVDATAVSDKLSIAGINNFPANTGKVDLVLLPFSGYTLQFASGISDLSFNVELGGKVTLNPPLSHPFTLENEAGRLVLRLLDAGAMQLKLPFDETGNTPGPLFSLTNAGIGQVVLATSKGDNALGFLGGSDPVAHQHAGVYGESDQQGVMGLTTSPSGTGVYGGGTDTAVGAQIGVRGETLTGVGVQGTSFAQGTGVVGLAQGKGNPADLVEGVGVYGVLGADPKIVNIGPGSGSFGSAVMGASNVEAGVTGVSSARAGVQGFTSGDHDAVIGRIMPYGSNQSSGAGGSFEGGATGVYGSGKKWGVRGAAALDSSFYSSGDGVYGESIGGAGVVGESEKFDGVFGISHNPKSAGLSGHNLNANGKDNPHGLAGWFGGDVQITQDLRVTGDVNVTGDINVAGDIALTGAGQDCAEEFDVTDAVDVEPGTVMVINKDGALQPSNSAYDKKVAGVVSGAGEYKPAIILGRQRQGGKARVPVALVGKVSCKVDARFAPVEVGDLLTTSPTPGHAMKADDPRRALGTLIGKALRPLKEGLGLIPILVSLQ